MKPNGIYQLVYFRVARLITRILPRPVFHLVATLIGRAVYANRQITQEIVRENLGRLSGLKGGELEKLCGANVTAFSKGLADYFFSLCCKPEQIGMLLAETRGRETIEAGLARGKGVILVTAHLGHWELGGTCLAMAGFPMNIVTAREPSEELNQWRQEYREKFRVKTITLGTDAFAFIEVINALKRNEIVAMLVDRPIGNSALPVEFCGGQTFFSNAPALLHHHTNAAIIPAFTLQGAGNKYVLFADPEIAMEPANGSRQLRGAMARNTQKIATVFGELVRKHPDQWHNYVRIWTDEK